MIKYLWLLLCLCLLYACSTNKKTGATKNKAPETLRIMTYNIHHGTPIHSPGNHIDLEAIAAVINAGKPDLVALQEVDSMTRRAPVNEAEELGKLTGMYYFFSRTIDFQGGKYGDAVLSRFPLLATKCYRLPMPDTTGENRTVGIVSIEPFTGMKLDFATTHLDLMKENRMAQVNQLIFISRRSSDPLILAGDFNAHPGSKEIKTLEAAFAFACATNCPLTFPSDKPTSTIDYIILNPAAQKEFHIISYQAIRNIDASDHLPLMEYLRKQ